MGRTAAGGEILRLLGCGRKECGPDAPHPGWWPSSALLRAWLPGEWQEKHEEGRFADCSHRPGGATEKHTGREV